MDRRVGRRVSVHSGHYLDGTLLRHLSPADVAALADSPARVPYDLCRMGRRARRNDTDSHLSATAAHAIRRTQVRRDLGRPLLGKGIYACSSNVEMLPSALCTSLAVVLA